MSFLSKKVGDMTIIEFVLYLFVVNLIIVLISLGIQKLLK